MNYADTQLNTLSKQFDMLKQHLVALSVESGQGGLSTFLKDSVSAITDLISGFEKMDGSTIELTLAMAGLAVGLGKVIPLFETLKVVEEDAALATATTDALTGRWANLIAGTLVAGLGVYAIASGHAAEEQQKLNDAMAEAEKQAPQIVDQYKRRASEIDDLVQNIKLLNEQLNSPEAQTNPARKQSLEDDKQAALQLLKDMAGVQFAPQIDKATTMSQLEDLSKQIKDYLGQKANEADVKVQLGQGEEVTIDNLTERYVQLKKALDDSSLSEEDKAKKTSELHGVTEELVKLVPSLAQGWDNNGNRILALDGALKDSTQSWNNYIEVIKKYMAIDLQKQLDDQEKAIKSEQDKLNNLTKQKEQAINPTEGYVAAKAGLGLSADPATVKSLSDQIELQNEKVQQAKDKYNQLDAQLKHMNSTTKDATSANESLSKSFDGSADSGKELTEKTKDTKTAQEELHNAMKGFDLELANNNNLMRDLTNWQKLYVEGSEDWLRVENQKIELMKEKSKLVDAQIKNQEAELKLLQVAPVGGDTTGNNVNLVSAGGEVNTPYSSLIQKASTTYGIPSELIAGVIKQESDFQNLSANSAGAMGVMQVTGDSFHDYGSGSPMNPAENIMAGTNELSTYMKKYGDLKLALAAYNWGPGNVDRAIKATGSKDWDYIVANYAGVPDETRNYVPKVISNYTSFSGGSPSIPATSTSIDNSGDSNVLSFKTNAEKQSAILQVQQSLISLKGQSLDNQFAQQEGKLNKIIGTAGKYKIAIEDADKAQKAAAETQKMATKGSDEYNNSINDQITQLRKKQDYAHQEANYLRGQQDNSDLTSEQKRTIKNNISDLGTSFNQMQQEIASLQMDKLTGIKDAIDEDNKSVETHISTIKELADELKNAKGENQAYRDELAKQIPLLVQEEENRHRIAEAAREAIKSGTLNNEQMKQAQQIVDEATDSYWKYFNAIKSTNEEIAKSRLDEIVTNTTNALDPLKGQADLLNGQLDLMAKGNIKERQSLVDQLNSDYVNQIHTLQNSILTLQSQSDALKDNKDAWQANQKQILDYQNQVVSLEKTQQQLKDSLFTQIADMLTQQEDADMQRLQDQHKQTLDNMQENLKSIQQSYDDQTKSLEDQLKLLDQQYQTQDKIKQLNDANTAISQAENDTRFSYITADGKEVFTYDTSKVNDLVQKRDQLVTQYQRDDLKQSIQNEIDNLKDQKDQQTKILQDQIDQTKEQYSQQEEDTKNHWEELVNAAKNGTLKMSSLTSGWYTSELGAMGTFKGNVAGLIDQIKALYESIGQIQIQMPQIPQIPQIPLPQSGSVLNSNGAPKTPDQSGLDNTIIGSDGLTDYTRAVKQALLNNGGTNYTSSSTSSSHSSHSSTPVAGSAGGTPQSTGLNNTKIGSDGLTDYTRAAKDAAKKAAGFDTGGMTSTWGSEGKLAFLHEKEIVLNKFDTSNILKAVNLVRNLTSNIKLPDFSSIIPKLQPQTVDQSKHYSISNVTVQANDALSFLDSIHVLVRSQTN